MQVYYHGNVIPGGAYVVDSTEYYGPRGDAAHACLLSRFKDLLVQDLNCTLTA